VALVKCFHWSIAERKIPIEFSANFQPTSTLEEGPEVVVTATQPPLFQVNTPKPRGHKQAPLAAIFCFYLNSDSKPYANILAKACESQDGLSVGLNCHMKKG